MTTFLSAAAIAFGVILLVELPDKTLVATLVLATRYRPQPVLVGVALAFAVQCTIASVAGGLLHLLPHRLVEVVVAVLFAIGATLLIAESFREPEAVDLSGDRLNRPFWHVASTSFGVLFVAEWGDASQLATAGLVARLDEPVAVGIGAWLALVGVAILAAIAGKLIVRKIRVRVVHRVAGGLFLVFTLIAAVAAINA
jgi:putative Ca2+/H+ antiporter (TMEM165/GDT1 family)